MGDRIAFVLLTHRPHPAWMEFLAEHRRGSYDLFVVIDDETTPFSAPEGVQILRPTEQECVHAHFTGANFCVKEGRPSAWDKALFWACRQTTHYKYVWFVEDDVYVPSFQVIEEMDAAYPDSDLLCANHTVNESGAADGWAHWETQAKGKIRTPWANSMVCASRLSRRLLQRIDAYATESGHLLFIELCFNTLAVQNGYRIDTPAQLQTILFRHDWDTWGVDRAHLFHPVKHQEDHVRYRARQPRLLEAAGLLVATAGAVYLLKILFRKT